MAINDKGFTPKAPKAKTSKSVSSQAAQPSEGVQATSDSVGNSTQTMTSMQGVASANVAHFLQRMADERSATVEQVSDVIAWATDGHGIVADAVNLAAKKQLDNGRIPFVLPSLGVRLEPLQPSEYVDTSSLLPPAAPSESRQLQPSSPRREGKSGK